MEGMGKMPPNCPNKMEGIFIDIIFCCGRLFV
jgi:hypothetical protein